MDKQLRRNDPDVDSLIDAINKKLVANSAILLMSIDFGRMKWRRNKKGDFEIDLELNL